MLVFLGLRKYSVLESIKNLENKIRGAQWEYLAQSNDHLWRRYIVELVSWETLFSFPSAEITKLFWFKTSVCSETRFPCSFTLKE